ncbi:MAG: hypothetical protein SP1CHLAM54_03450 [Chlamydiia bacterium]|nr:hypothetical protein [Chlamydiia bacterium]MCH9615261.1 hypothetical protein [Chlamydiia bacterium]MCH9628417.1 hypothetical protein [Chlamydiia bacterium]
MIVKDEQDVIERCLTSVKGLIDYWVIVDTGSSDRTIEIIKQCMQDIPGELHQRPWKNFGYNRNEALELALGKGEYILFLDADETLSIDENFSLNGLNQLAYLALGKCGGNRPDFYRKLLVKSCEYWRWQGVIHEQLRHTKKALPSKVLPGIRIMADHEDGNRAKDPNKHLKDAKILENALEEEPSNPDYVFFLAQTYALAGDEALSRDTYLRYTNMGVSGVSVFWALFVAAYKAEQLGLPEETVIGDYLRAYDNLPSRAEPLVCLADYLLRRGKPHAAYLFALIGASLGKPTDTGYVLNEVYKYQSALVLAKCARATKRFDEANRLYQDLLKIGDLPEEIRTSITAALGP